MIFFLPKRILSKTEMFLPEKIKNIAPKNSRVYKLWKQIFRFFNSDEKKCFFLPFLDG